jgi:hypothetical protein
VPFLSLLILVQIFKIQQVILTVTKQQQSTPIPSVVSSHRQRMAKLSMPVFLHTTVHQEHTAQMESRQLLDAPDIFRASL